MTIREYYKTETKKMIPVDFHIHHINFKRSENTILNLVALPRKLHLQYHYRHSAISPINSEMLYLKSATEKGHAAFPYVINELLEFKNIWIKCNEWINYRDHLLGLLPRITGEEY